MSADDVSTDEAALVFRRAAEIDLTQMTGETRALDVAALEQAGLEAGLSRQAIRQALAEVRARSTEMAADAVVSRTVAGDAGALQSAVKQFMREQGFRVARDLGDRAIWERDPSFAATIRRTLDFNRKIRLREVRKIVTVVVPIPGERGRCHVRFELDLKATRWAWRALPASVGAVGIATVAALAATGIEPAAIIAAPSAAIAAGGALAGARAGYRGSRNRSVNAIEFFLDRLERR